MLDQFGNNSTILAFDSQGRGNREEFFWEMKNIYEDRPFSSLQGLEEDLEMLNQLLVSHNNIGRIITESGSSTRPSIYGVLISLQVHVLYYAKVTYYLTKINIVE